ncbi:MAG TPA: hypothetical protein VG223_17420 [Solirubrobacteraceae bacterium]|jgi:hypothetical protein|nr:hypothetical protein [Solirubrobacteraceae bacterium]
MSGLLTSARPRVLRPSLPRLSVRARLERSRQRAAERAYRQMVARDHQPRELDTSFYRDVSRYGKYR